MDEYVWISNLSHHPEAVKETQVVLARKAEEHGVIVTFAGPDGDDPNVCVQAIRDAVDRRVAGIMVGGAHHPDVAAAIADAARAGVPVTAIAGVLVAQRGGLASRAFDMLYRLNHSDEPNGDSVRPQGPSADLDAHVELITPDTVHAFRASADSGEVSAQYRLMLDTLGDAVHMVDRDLRIIQTNAALTGWLSHLRLETEIAGKTIGEAFPFLQPHVFEEYAQVFASGEPLVTFEETSLGGEIVISETRKIPVVEDGRVVSVLSVIRDVTEAHRVRQRLEESQRRISVLMDNLPGMAYRCANDAEWTMEFVSSGCRQLTGYAPEDLLGNARLSYSDVVHPDDREMLYEAVQRGIAADEAFALTYRIVTAHGSEKWVWEQGTAVLGEGGELLALEGFIADITARVLAEQEKEVLQERLGRAHRMEEVGQLAGGIAHDFNNLLGGIMGYADLIKRKLIGQPELVPYAEAVVESAARASELTAQLLAFSQRARLRSVPVDLHKVVERIAEHLSLRVGPAIEILLHLDAIEAVVQGDADQLGNVVLDIAENAVEAMPDGGSLTFRTFAIDLDQAACRRRALAIDPGRYLNLIIEDTGMGMGEAVLPHIFEPFFTTKTAGDGVGLGLAAAWGIVREHRGTVEVASEPGEGSVFGLYLPLPRRAPRQMVEEQVAIEEAPIAGQSRVLLVEDDPRVGEAVSSMLEQLGYKVTMATDGEEALHTYRQAWAELDLVMLDLVMPGISGVQVLQGLREINPAARVLLTSGYDLSAGEIAAEDIAETDFLRKPFGVQELSVAVKAALQRSAPPGRA